MDMKNDRFTKLLLNLPLILFLVLLVVFPAVYALIISFYDVSLSKSTKGFQGLGNYLKIITNKSFWSSIFFSVKYTAISLFIQIILGFLIALLFNRTFPGKKILMSIMLMPIMIAPSLMGIMYRLLLNENIGVLTELFKKVGITMSLFSNEMVFPLLIVLDALQWTPFVFLILYSALQGIDKTLYEAASVDGATKWKQVINITIPSIFPIIIIVSFLRGIDAFRTFDVIYVLTSGGPGTATTTISIFLYKLGFKDGSFSLAAASSIIVIMLLMLIMPLFVKKIVRN